MLTLNNFLDILVDKNICDYRNKEYVFPCIHIPNYEKLKVYFSAEKQVGYCHNCSTKVTLAELLDFIQQRYGIDYKKYNVNLDDKQIIHDNNKNNDSDKISIEYKLDIGYKREDDYIEPDLRIKLCDYPVRKTFPKYIREYLINRKIDINVAKKYGLKYIRFGSISGILISVKSVYGNNIVGAQIRIVNNNDYMSKVAGITGSRKMSFFGIDQFVPIDNTLLLTESWGNVLSYVSQTKEQNIVASMGSGLTGYQLKNLRFIKTKYDIKHLVIISDLKMVDKNFSDAKILINNLKLKVSVFNIREALDNLGYKYTDKDDIDINDIIKKYNNINIKDIILKYMYEVHKVYKPNYNKQIKLL